jgi:hypothetical protein
MAAVEQTIEAFLPNEDSPDIGNPIHSTEVAQSFGFKGALVGGVTVWGWATDAILEALGESWLDRGWSDFMFRQPTYPGDRLAIRVEPNSDAAPDAYSVTMTNQDGVLCVVASVGLGDAPWIDQFVTPGDMTAKPSPDPIPPIVMGQTPVDVDWRAASAETDTATMEEFLARSLPVANPLFVPTDSKPAPLHPGWIAGRGERLLRHNVTLPQSIHTRSQIQHLARAMSGQETVTGAHLLDIYDRKGHHFANFDCLMVGEDGTPLTQLRHWTIVKVAKADERG